MYVRCLLDYVKSNFSVPGSLRDFFLKLKDVTTLLSMQYGGCVLWFERVCTIVIVFDTITI